MRTYSKKQDLLNRLKMAAVIIAIGFVVAMLKSCGDPEIKEPLSGEYTYKGFAFPPYNETLQFDLKIEATKNGYLVNGIPTDSRSSGSGIYIEQVIIENNIKLTGIYPVNVPTSAILIEEINNNGTIYKDRSLQIKR